MSEQKIGSRWGIDFTKTAAQTLAGIPRSDQAKVAVRIEHLAASGIPPALLDDKGGGTSCQLVVDQWVLTCTSVPDERRIVVLALDPLRESFGRTVLRRIVGFLPLNRRTAFQSQSTGGEIMGSLLQDLKFTIRSFRRSPGFTLSAVLTLALGIGASGAIFSVANGVLLTPLPYDDPEEIVTVWSSWIDFPEKTWVSFAEFQYYTQESRTLEGLALYQRFTISFTSVDNPERVGAVAVTPNMFALLGVEPVVGRFFEPRAGQEPVPPVLLSYELWQRRYGGTPDIVGRDVELNGVMSPVIGILPAGFALPLDYGSSSVAEVYFPVFIDVEAPAQVPTNGGSHGSYVIGRLAAGQTVQTAANDLQELSSRLEAAGIYPAEMNFRPVVFGVKSDIVGSARNTIFVLMGAVGFLLLIACGNVANLLLSRSQARAGEVAVRAALGADRGRIVRQLLTESMVLATVGGVLGLLLAFVGVNALLALDPLAIPRSESVNLDSTVIGFTIGVAILTALLFGVIPALRVSRSGVSSTLRTGSGRGQRGRHGNRAQGVLVAAQMAMAVILLTGSGLMMKTFVSLLRVDPGFETENVLTMRLMAPAARYPDLPSVVGFYGQLLDRVRDMPGVETVGASRLLPLASDMGTSGFVPVDLPGVPGDTYQAEWQWSTPGYLEAMGIALREGRSFESTDGPESQSVVVINEKLARQHWGQDSPIGARIRAGGSADTSIVIGVVEDVSHNGITSETKARFYRPHAQVTFPGSLNSARAMTLVVKGREDPAPLIAPIRQEIRAADPAMPISEVQTLDQVRSTSVAQPRFAMVLLGAFALIALLLAVIGIYGVLAYAVSQRTKELSIRLAMGAERRQVVGMVVREGLRMAVLGVAIGAMTAWFLTSLMSGLLYGVEAQDPSTFAAVTLLFILIAALASWVPASRAARVPPAGALRGD